MEEIKGRVKYNCFNELDGLISALRGEKGCPWDKKQTSRSVTVYLIEEVYELVEAIHAGDPDAVMEELGDVLFQIFFISHLFCQAGHFDMADVVETVIAKMKRRHPHVFGNETIKEVDQVKARWREIKSKEKKKNSDNGSLLNSIPSGLPALLRAYRVSERAAGVGFDWDNIDEVMAQVKKEWIEFLREIKAQKDSGEGNRNVAMEFGDILFSLVNVARFARIHPETSLMESIQKFEHRFQSMERTVLDQGKKFEELSRNDWDILWRQAKTAP